MGASRGSPTSNGQLRRLRVIGQTTRTDERVLYVRDVRTIAGRRPPCSCPTGRPKSIQRGSPASGAAAFATLPLRVPPRRLPFLVGGRYVAPIVVGPWRLDRRPVLERRRLLPRLDLRQQVLQAVIGNP